MAITLDDYQNLLRKVERLAAKREQAVGAKKELLKRLKQEFGVDTLKQAVILLEELKDKEIAAGRKYAKAKISFENKYRKQLRELK